MPSLPIELPIDGQTFKKSFLGGNGSISLQSDQDWKSLITGNQPFTPHVDSLAKVDVDLAANSSLKFGGGEPTDLKLDLDVSSQTVGGVRLIWDLDDEAIKTYGVKDQFTANHYFALLSFKSKASASVNGTATFFGGPLKATFGIGAGGNVDYERLIRLQRTDPASDVIKEVFGGIRLPQSVKTVAEIPADGEVIDFSYGGYLNLSAGLAWGYSLAGTRNIEVSNLQISLDYAVRLVASASYSYRIAGDFNIEARKGHAPNWARIVVRKSKESNSKFAFDFGLTASESLKGIPESPDKLLEALLGIDTHSFMKVLNEVKDLSTVDGIKSKLTDLTEEFVLGKANDWLGKAIDESNVAAFLQIVNRVVETYKNIDEKIIHLYEDFLNDIPGLMTTLQELENLPDRLGLGRFNQTADKAIWDLIRRLAGDKFYEVLLSDEEFNKFSDFIKEVKKFLTSDTEKFIRDYIASIKAEFPLNGLFGQIDQIDTPEKITALADKKLKGLIEKIVGDAIDGNSHILDKVLKPLQSFFANLAKFNKAYSGALEKAVNQSIAFNLNFAYNNATKGETLFDVEIDLSHAAGSGLAEKALHGDFTELLQTFNPIYVRLNQAFFKKEITKSAELKINVFNYNQRGVVQLVQQSEHSIESLANGLLNVYSIDTNQGTLDEKSWRKNKEAIKTNFALKIVGSSLQPAGSVIDPDVVENLKQISAQYTASYEDSQTEIRELRQYLGLAALLKLVSTDDAINSLVSKLGKANEKDNLGSVKLEYVAKYSDEAVREAFTSPISVGFQDLLRGVIREITAAPFMSKPINDNQCSMRLAYRSNDVFQAYRTNDNSLSGLAITVAAPTWHKSFPAQQSLNSTQKQLLEFFYRREDSIVQRFPKLVSVLQGFPNVNFDDLQAEARNFVSLSNDLLVNNADNPFFALFDWFVRTRSSVANQRQSALIMSIQTVLADGTPFDTTMYFTG